MGHEIVPQSFSPAACVAPAPPSQWLERALSLAEMMIGSGDLKRGTLGEPARGALLKRLDELVLALAPCQAAKIPAILTQLDAMMAPGDAGDALTVAQAKLDLRDLSGLPEFALRGAIEAFRRGAVGDGKFRPRAGEIRLEALTRAQPFARERWRLEALKLEALPEPGKPIDEERRRALAEAMRGAPRAME